MFGGRAWIQSLLGSLEDSSNYTKTHRVGFFVCFSPFDPSSLEEARQLLVLINDLRVKVNDEENVFPTLLIACQVDADVDKKAHHPAILKSSSKF